jgi:hypothetical protein
MAKKPSLASFSIEELQAEIYRRQKGVLPLSDFYFMEEDEDEYDEDDQRITFMIVHKRRWHLEHCSDDGAFDSYISQRLPNGFHFIQESIIEYKPKHLRKKKEPEPTVKDAIELLKSAGATFIKEPWFDSLITHLIKYVGNERYYYFNVNVDTQDVKDDLHAWQQKNNSPANVEDYIERMKAWAKSRKLHVEVISKSETTSHIALMTKHVWNKLPEFPRDEEDDDS